MFPSPSFSYCSCTLPAKPRLSNARRYQLLFKTVNLQQLDQIVRSNRIRLFLERKSPIRNGIFFSKNRVSTLANTIVGLTFE